MYVSVTVGLFGTRGVCGMCVGLVDTGSREERNGQQFGACALRRPCAVTMNVGLA